MAPLRALAAAALLCAAVPASSIELTCRVPAGRLNKDGVPDTQLPGHSREPIGLDCGGQASAFCSALRRGFVEKTPPAVTPAAIKAACDATAAEHWSGVWQGVLALQRGHNYTGAEKKAADEAYHTVRSALFRIVRRDDFVVLDALKTYYLGKSFVVSPQDDQRVAVLVGAALTAFEKRLDDVRAGKLTKEDWENWGIVSSLIERYYITPGSNLPAQAELLRRFDALARYLDVHELLRSAEQDEAARARYVRGEELTSEGVAVAEKARAGRERLRSFGLDHVAASLANAPAPPDPADAAALEAARDRLKASAVKTADALERDRTDDALAGLEGLRGPNAAPPKPTRDLLAKLPADIPAYLARLDPAYTAFLLRLEETEDYKRHRLGAVNSQTTGLDLRLLAAERAYADILGRKQCGADAACSKSTEAERQARAKEIVRGKTGDFRWLSLQAAQKLNQKAAGETLTEIGKALLPGYACYELYDHWDKSTKGQKAAEGAFCGLGVVPVVSAIARAARFVRGARAATATQELTAAERALAHEVPPPAAGPLTAAPPAPPPAAKRVVIDGRVLTEEERRRHVFEMAYIGEKLVGRESAYISFQTQQGWTAAKVVRQEGNQVWVILDPLRPDALHRLSAAELATARVSERARELFGARGPPRVYEDDARELFQHALKTGNVGEQTRYIKFRDADGVEYAARIDRISDGKVFVGLDARFPASRELTRAELETTRVSQTARHNLPPPTERFDIGTKGDRIAGGERSWGHSVERPYVDWHRDPTFSRFYDDFIARTGLKDAPRPLPGAQRSAIFSKLFPEVNACMSYDHALAAEVPAHMRKPIPIGDFIKRGKSICRHMGMASAAMLERLVHEGYLTGRAFYVEGKGHAWAVYRNSKGQHFVIDHAQNVFEPMTHGLLYHGSRYKRGADGKLVVGKDGRYVEEKLKFSYAEDFGSLN